MSTRIHNTPAQNGTHAHVDTVTHPQNGASLQNSAATQGRIVALTDIGYSTLEDIAKEQPTLLRTGTPLEIRSAMEEHARTHQSTNADTRPHADTRMDTRTHAAANPPSDTQQNTRPSSDTSYPLFAERRSWQVLDIALTQLTADAVAGPKRDAVHAQMLYKALPSVTRADMSDRRVLASIGCFNMPGYSDIRWGSSKFSKSTKLQDQSKFVKEHYLGDNKQGNSIARLWWLYEFAESASEHSQHDTLTLLDAMANHVNFYHQMLRRSYLNASSRVRAFLLDIALENGLLDRNNTRETSRMLQQLNLAAGAVNLDILSDAKLMGLIKEVMPPKEDAV